MRVHHCPDCSHSYDKPMDIFVSFIDCTEVVLTIVLAK